MAKQRVQVYLDAETAEEVKRRTSAGHRPVSWELEHLIRLGLKAKAAEEEQKAE